MLDTLEAASRAGATVLSPPWPPPDIDRGGRGGWIWAPYSPERMLERTRAVYAGVIEVYRALVRAHFSALAPRLWHWRVLPARLVGTLDPGSPESWQGHPGMAWWLEPLDPGAADEVNIELGLRADRTEPHGLDERFRAARPDAAEIPPYALSLLRHIEWAPHANQERAQRVSTLALRAHVRT